MRAQDFFPGKKRTVPVGIRETKTAVLPRGSNVSFCVILVSGCLQEYLFGRIRLTFPEFIR